MEFANTPNENVMVADHAVVVSGRFCGVALCLPPQVKTLTCAFFVNFRHYQPKIMHMHLQAEKSGAMFVRKYSGSAYQATPQVIKS